MEKLTKKEKKAVVAIKFNKDFYNSGAVKKAALAYKGLADFHLKDNHYFIEVTIKNVNQDFKDVINDEFCNYVLAETKNASWS